MQQNIELERCIDFLVRMIDKCGDEVLRELEEEKQNKKEKTAQNTSERVWLRMFWRIDRTFKMTYTLSSVIVLQKLAKPTGVGEPAGLSLFCFKEK